ncbi:MAG: transposase, partial [Eggerthellaceae bacterium]|nr:transposase [Eggerthellaceae bacterium]
TLQQDTSCVNALSRFSWKSRVKGVKNISVIYAYDIEEMEPICAEVFPGNAIDATCYASFIRDNDLKRGIIIADKGFPPRCIKDELKERPDLHFLTPIKRNDVRIKNNDMLSFEGAFMYLDDRVTYKKAKIRRGRYLYAYRSDAKASKENRDFLTRRIKRDDYTQEADDKKRSIAGVIVFESDLDMDPEIAYLSYQERWLLELVFDRYKNDEELDATHVHDNASVKRI